MIAPAVFQINTLRKRAERFASETTSNDEIFRMDITNLLEKEIRYQVKNGEIVIIEVKGKPRTGKSTVGLVIGEDWIDDELKSCGKKEKSLKFGMRNVARDEQEYSEKMSNGTLMNDVILTDEQNELEKGGENATTEQQLKSVFSDVQAGRYVHRVSVSPEQVIDDNSDIWIETVGIDSRTMITHCRVYYRINNAQTKFWQPIGYINVSVRRLIKNWEEKVKKVFLRTKKSDKEEKFISDWSRKDFYVLYMIKKYQKMELITRYNILRPRDLPFAKVILEVVKDLKAMTEYMTLDVDLVKNYVEMGIRKNNLRASIIGKKLVTDRANGILKVYRSYHRAKKQEKAEIARAEDKGGDIKQIVKRYKEIYSTMEKVISKQLEEFELYVGVYNEYLKDVK